MKKLIAIVMTLALLLSMAGCQRSSGRDRRDDDIDDKYENIQSNDGGLALPGGAEDDGSDDGEPSSGGEEAAADQASGVAYEILEMDDSLRNDNGDILILRTYGKVVLQGDDPAYEAINEQIEADHQAFLDSETYWTVEELEESIANGMFGYGDLMDTVSASVVHNADGYISIHMTIDWFMGGVYNCDSYGLTYDLDTGEEAKVEDILGLPADEALEQLNGLACEHLKAYYGEALFTDPMDILEQYTLEDYAFYLENGELVLTFSTYEFAPGAAGSATIHTGLYIGG